MEIEIKTKTLLYLNEEEKELIKKCVRYCIYDNLIKSVFNKDETTKLHLLEKAL